MCSILVPFTLSIFICIKKQNYKKYSSEKGSTWKVSSPMSLQKQKQKKQNITVIITTHLIMHDKEKLFQKKKKEKEKQRSL